MDRLFGTDGIRGIVNRYPMTVEVALRVGKAISEVIRKENRKGSILIGKDTRISGSMLEMALASGICAMGCNSLLLGYLPTAAIAFLTRTTNADAGIVISASHNPYEYNGIKVFSREGFKLSDKLEIEIEEIVKKGERESAIKVEEIGRIKIAEDVKERYISFLKSLFPYSLSGMKILLDCANGATYEIAPRLFEELGAKVLSFEVSPDGLNINRGCGSEYPEHVRSLVVSHGADIGIAFDGDGDRVVIVDEKGEILNGDRIMATVAPFLKEKAVLKKNTVVATILSNKGLEEYLREKDIGLIRTKVGDKYVLEEMLKEGLNFGGERSGHIVFLDHNTTGDGILTALKVLEVVKEKGKTLSELKKGYFEYPQIERKVPVQEKRPLNEIPEIKSLLEEIERALGRDGRIIVRYSGTESVLRIMIEGKEEKEIKAYADEIERMAKKYL